MATANNRLVTGPPVMAPDDHEHADLLRNFGEHKLMESVQAALNKQLKAQLARVEAELREQEEARDKAQKARQHVGVELYGVQQQLSRLQVQLDTASGAVVALHDIRSKAEADLKTFQAGFAARKAQIDGEEARLEKFKGELDGILDTIRQVERYQEDMNAEIALNRRTAHKTDEALGERERAKAKQDHYIDDLTRQLQRSSAQLAALEAQIAGQKAETATAAEAMTDAMREMDTISGEKRQLMLQWQSSLIAMRRRDEVLQATHVAVKEQAELLDSMDAEENNVRRAIVATQDGHARLQDQVRPQKHRRLSHGSTASAMTLLPPPALSDPPRTRSSTRRTRSSSTSTRRWRRCSASTMDSRCARLLICDTCEPYPTSRPCFPSHSSPFSSLPQERQAALSGALEQTDAEVKRLSSEQSTLLKAMRDADASRALTDRQRFGIEDEINEHKSNRTTHEKAARAMLKNTKRLSDLLHELELQAAQVRR
jgi:chromosome segregation ATPase